jgi:hypothetical protein
MSTLDTAGTSMKKRNNGEMEREKGRMKIAVTTVSPIELCDT